MKFYKRLLSNRINAVTQQTNLRWFVWHTELAVDVIKWNPIKFANLVEYINDMFHRNLIPEIAV